MGKVPGLSRGLVRRGQEGQSWRERRCNDAGFEDIERRPEAKKSGGL